MGSPLSVPQPLTVLVVDADDSSRIGAAILLRRVEGIAACLVAAGLEDALPLARAHRPDVVVLDISRRGPEARRVAAELGRATPAARLVLTSHCGAAAPSGPWVEAAPFVPAGSGAAALGDAVLAAAAAATAELTLPPASTAGPEALSAREREIFAWLAEGLTNREIAEEVQLSPHAVKKHASAIFRKLGVRNRTEATKLARD